MTEYKKPLPRIDGPNRPFWEAARDGRLLLQRCLDCGTWRFPAARYCPSCRGERSEWQAASGRATLESFCLFHKPYFDGFADELPYNVIQVRLEEGVQLFSNLVAVANDRAAIGMPLQARFERVTDAVTLLKFAPAEAAP
ncbi:MAG: OB-fold domain-containing protein [Alphaproteobacteria bacterium]|nr:OB-fold domain-containing protein [Alphaproteobacteria bacterium]